MSYSLRLNELGINDYFYALECKKLSVQPSPIKCNERINDRLNKDFTLTSLDPKTRQIVQIKPIDTWRHAFHVIFSMPEIFTQTSTEQHLPAIVKSTPKYKSDDIPTYIIAKTNREAMHIWSTSFDSQHEVQMIPDSLGVIAHSWGLGVNQCKEVDGSLGVVWPRGAFFVADGTILSLTLEENPEECTATMPEVFYESCKPLFEEYGIH